MTIRGGAGAGDGERLSAPGGMTAAMTFIVRVRTNEAGSVVGVIEHAGTGRKERFDGVEAISDVIATLMVAVGRRAARPDERRGAAEVDNL